VRVEGTKYAEFAHVKGTNIGFLSTEDEDMINALRAHKQFGTAFTEVKDEKEFKEKTAVPVQKELVKLPRVALMACNKNELISIANQYSVQIEDSDTKSEIIDKIFKSQESQPAVASVQPVEVGPDNGIKKIVQNAGQGS
jgi:hypothetical protein